MSIEKFGLRLSSVRTTETTKIEDFLYHLLWITSREKNIKRKHLRQQRKYLISWPILDFLHVWRNICLVMFLFPDWLSLFTFLSCSVHESKLDETSGDYKQTNKQTQMRSLTPHPSSLSSSALEIFVK